MDLALPAALALGIVSGLKHAFEPDHVIAVSTLAHTSPRPGRLLRLGASWGAGHTTTLVLGVLVIGLLRLPLSDRLLAYFELPVAAMLVVLGIWALASAVSHARTLRRHTHEGVPHAHTGPAPHPHRFQLVRAGWQGYLVGLVHGLAGSGALMLLVAATLPGLWLALLYALLFGVGSIAGMAAVTLLLAVPFGAARRRPAFYHALTGVSGVLSIGLGAIILYGFVA